jgi:hypothetical protein
MRRGSVIRFTSVLENAGLNPPNIDSVVPMDQHAAPAAEEVDPHDGSIGRDVVNPPGIRYQRALAKLGNSSRQRYFHCCIRSGSSRMPGRIFVPFFAAATCAPCMRTPSKRSIWLVWL